MVGYIARRLLQAVPLLLGISLLSFWLLRQTPGGPLGAYVGPGTSLSGAELAAVERDFGLDQPVWDQFAYWLVHLVQGDWGYSLRTKQPVVEMIVERLPATLELIIAAVLVSLLIAIPVGVYSAARSNTSFDYVARAVSFAGYSVPIFWFGFLMMYLFALVLGWLPAGGRTTPGGPGTFIDRLQHVILPATTLALALTANWTRHMRSSLLEQLGQDYVRTAYAKGLSERQAILGHALRNALIPVVTVVLIQIPLLFGGTIVIEKVFAWPGEGSLLLSSLARRDYPVIQGILLIISLLVVLANLLADIIYAWLDPRVRYRGVGE